MFLAFVLPLPALLLKQLLIYVKVCVLNYVLLLCVKLPKQHFYLTVRKVPHLHVLRMITPVLFETFFDSFFHEWKVCTLFGSIRRQTHWVDLSSQIWVVLCEFLVFLLQPFDCIVFRLDFILLLLLALLKVRHDLRELFWWETLFIIGRVALLHLIGVVSFQLLVPVV